MKKLLNMLIIATLFTSCASKADFPVVKDLDIEKYSGKWYEIARLPNSFEKGLDRVTAEYILRSDGRIDVINTGFIEGTDTKKSTNGIAKIPDKTVKSKIKVSFFRPFWGDYQILALDQEYQFALVGGGSFKYLWILSRDKNPDINIINNYIEIASKLGFETDNLIMVNQR